MACSVALDYIKHVIETARRPVVFGDDARFKPYAPKRWHSRETPDAPQEPSAQLVARFECQPLANILSRCKPVRHFLTDRHLPYGPGAVKRAKAERVDGCFSAEIIAISIPVISDDATEALLAVNVSAGIQMESGRVVYLRRNDEMGWTVAASGGIWMS